MNKVQRQKRKDFFLTLTLTLTLTRSLVDLLSYYLYFFGRSGCAVGLSALSLLAPPLPNPVPVPQKKLAKDAAPIPKAERLP